MAYLNVRERRIEARIAYVGSQLAGKATNFEQLRLSKGDARIGKIEASTSDDGELLSLAWLSPKSRFRDCDVVVKIVAARGAVSTERFADVLREADGVVFVVDAQPSAQQRNLESLEAMRSVMARADSREVPVVLQVNKTDLADSLSADAVVGALKASDLTHVVAAAVRGEGVIETLEAALDEILSTMQTELEPNAEGTSATVRPGVANGNGTTTTDEPSSTSDRGHPLLAALRQVLRETVREHVAELESRVTARLETSLARIDERLEASEAVTARLSQELKALPVLSKEDLGQVGARVDRVRDELKAEMVRTLEARARADREYLATATANLKKSVEAMSAEMRTFDVRARVGALVDSVTALEGRAELLGSSSASAEALLQGLLPRIELIEASVRRAAKADDALRGLKTQMNEAFVATGEKTDAVHARVNEIVEELKKPKKGWFT